MIADNNDVALAKKKEMLELGHESTSVDHSLDIDNGRKCELVLLVADSETRFGPLRRGLESKAYRVRILCDSTDVLRTLREIPPSLVLVDLGARCLDDDRVWLRTACERYEVPVIGIVPVHEDAKTNDLLTLEFDDFVARTACWAELDLRIRLLLARWAVRSEQTAPIERRVRGDRRRLHLGRREIERHKALRSKASPRLTVGPFEIDDYHKTVRVSGHLRRLSPKEYVLLKRLAESTERVVSSEEIVTLLWPESVHASNNEVQQYVHLLRRKVEVDPKRPRWIKTIKGFGYMLVVDERE